MTWIPARPFGLPSLGWDDAFLQASSGDKSSSFKLTYEHRIQPHLKAVA